MSHHLLEQVDHRSYPPPRGPWVMTQTWEELLFAHWSFAPEQVQALLPEPLEIDTFDGKAWVAVVPFLMTGVRPRFCPAVPYLSRFLELNVRTYVRLGDASGVFFFSLDAANPVAVEVARAWFHLPYMNALMRMSSMGQQQIYQSRRRDRRGGEAELSVSYCPAGDPFQAQPGSLEHFLTERYCLLAERDGSIIRGDIHHVAWPLQEAEAQFTTNTMLAPLGLKSEGEPHLLYSKSIETIEWAPRRLQTREDRGSVAEDF